MQVNRMACPLCGGERAHASWLGTTYYRGREFPYVACAACGTLYCAPMPDASTLAEMYGPDYTQEGGAAGHVENPKEPGRVVEWLARLDEQMPEILRLVKPGGLLLAQGPLEANASLFTSVLATARRLRPKRRTEMAPYHVLLATARGQREFFRRFGLEEIEYTLREVSWPAPSGLMLADLGRPRAVGLFALRRCSQALSALRPRVWGNRYFYVGRKPN